MSNLIDELRGPPLSIADYSPEAQDALRGTAWMSKWRGSLENFWDQQDDQKSVLRNTIQRTLLLRVYDPLLHHYPPPQPGRYRPSHILSRCKGVLGTYRWNYRPEVIWKALEEGLAIDTAPTYGRGRAEKTLETMGIAGTLLTKFRQSQSSPSSILRRGRQLRKMFPRCKILLQVHWPDNRIFGSVRILDRMVNEGVINGVGLSNCSWDMVSRCAQRFQIDSLQIRFNVNDSGSGDYLVPNALRAGISVLGYSPLGQGELVKTTGPQPLLSFCVHHNVIPIFQTNSLDHLRENLKAIR